MNWLRRHWPLAVVVGSIATGVGRIAATYPVFYQTWDEPSHIAAGLEWLQHGTFRFEAMHPPLPRVTMAIGPYLAGLRLPGTVRPDSLEFYGGQRALFEQGNAVLDEGGGAHYQRNLTLARLGNLAFFVLACLMVWGWGRELFGAAAGAAAAALMATLPSVLGHSGIATTDMALVATFAGVLWVWTRWLAEPTWRRTLGAGAVTGFALISKMSAIAFFPPCLLALAVLRWRLGPRAPVTARVWMWRAVAAGGAAAFVIWGGYRFSVGRLTDVDARLPQRIESRLGNGAVARTLIAAADIPIVPAPEFPKGVKDLIFYNATGRKTYLLGRVVPQASMAFFPIAAFFKTPLPFLLLAGLGAIGVLRRQEGRRWEWFGPVAAAALIFAVVIPSKLNIGSRHVLPAFAALAVLAGFGTVRLWHATWPRRAGPLLAAALLAWQGIAGIRAHPDYLAYFNEAAALAPQPILLDSDLDWGQDLKRLADTLRTLPVDTLLIAYHGSADLARRLPVPVKTLLPWQPARGWIAISLYKLKMGLGSAPRSDHYAWLEGEQPVARVGKSILLYHLP